MSAEDHHAAGLEDLSEISEVPKTTRIGRKRKRPVHLKDYVDY